MTPAKTVSFALRAAGTTRDMVLEQLKPKGQALAKPPRGSGLEPVRGDPGPPIIGYSFAYLGDPVKYARRRYERYGPVSWSRSFGIRLVSLVGPDATKAMLINSDKAFSQAGWDYFIGPFFRRGLMLLDFEEHRHHRLIMQEAFTPARLRGYLGGLNAGIAEGIAKWEDDAAFMMHPSFKQLTLDLATQVFVGEPRGPEADQVNAAFFDTVQAGTAFVRFAAPGGRWDRGLKGREVLEDFFRSKLAQKRASDGDDIFTALCHAETDDGHGFSDEDVVNHMIFLMMAAHDTSTTTLTAMSYYTGKHQEWQERMREESRALGKEVIDYEDMEALPTMRMVMKEAQRLVTPVPAMARKTVKNTEVLGHYIPSGTMAHVLPMFTHVMDEFWPNPRDFDPGRFSDDRREDKVHPYAWAPFGGGAHKCIGMYFGNMEVSAVMHQLLLTHRWSVDPDYVMPVNNTSLPYPDDGLPVHLERIS